jgi:hypothetical protein
MDKDLRAFVLQLLAAHEVLTLATVNGPRAASGAGLSLESCRVISAIDYTRGFGHSLLLKP